MKLILRIVLLIVIVLISYGLYANNVIDGEGEKFIGIGVLIFAFILMPLFIYYRYYGKDLSRYSIQNMFKDNPKSKHEDKE